MPWTWEDAKDHKSGLSEKSAKQWARIANSVLARCMKKGGDEKTCAAAAIKQANGVVNTNSEGYAVYKNKQEDAYEPEIKIHQGKPYLTIPVVMMVEGVHNGSHGPLLHLAEDLGKFPASWDGIPVVIDHPEKDGVNVSANSPDIIDTRAVGRVYNTNMVGKKLKSEVWLDEDKLNDISPESLEAVNAGRILEVSVGVFTEEEEVEGDYGKEHYKSIARNHRPDHLAILTECVGACSIKDGCGLGVNENNIDMEIKTFVSAEKLTETIKSFNKEGFILSAIGNYADQGYNERMSMIYDKLRSLDTSKTYNYLEECYDDYLIYSVSGDNNRKMYKQSYKIESGKIEFVGEPVEVHKKVEYVLNSIIRTKFKKEDSKMSENKCPKCVEKINALINNKESGFTEDDRAWLDTLSESALDKIAPKVIEKEKIVEKTIEVNKLSPEDQAALAFGKKQMKERKEAMIKGIQDNAGKELWPDTVLANMDEDTLERVFNSVKKDEVVNYSVVGSGKNIVNNDESDPMPPAGISFETKK